MTDLESAIEKLEEEIEVKLGAGRLLEHSRSVAEQCRLAAERLDRPDAHPRAAFLAGLAHDLYRGDQEGSLRELILRESVPVDAVSWKIGRGLLHGPVAAHYLRNVLKVHDQPLIAAVYYHTTSRAGACTLERILFCADYLDPLRRVRSEENDLDSLRSRMTESLTEVYRLLLGRKLGYVLAKGRPLHPEAIRAWNELCRGMSG